MNVLKRLAGLNKPLPGAVLNWGHPLAPIHPRACVLPLNDRTETIRDAANGRTFTRAVTFAGDAANNWTASGFPVANGVAFRSSISSNTAFTKFTAPGAVDTASNTNNPFCTLAVIFLKLSDVPGGPRPLGNGDNRSMILEPGFNNTGNAYVLSGSVAHVNTGLPWTTNNWGFFGASCSPDAGGSGVNVLRAVVHDYKSNTTRTVNTTFGTGESASSGAGSTLILGGTDTATGTQTGTDGLIYWGMIDYAEWSVSKLIELSQNPFGMFSDQVSRSYFFQSSGADLSFSASSALSLGASAAVAQGMSLSASSALSLGSAAALTFVGPPLTISTTSALSLGAASTVTLTSPNVDIGVSSALSLGSSAALSFGTATTISTTSALSLGASAAVTLTSQAVSFSASSALSLGASAAVTLTTATTIAAASSLSLGASAAVTFGGSVATSISTTSALSLGASVQVAFTSAYATLLEAVVATLRAGMVTPGDLTGVFERTPPTLLPPYATCVEIGNSRDWANTSGGWIDSGQIQVTVYATRKKAARTLGDSVAVLLNDAGLSFDEGSLMLLRQDSRFAQADPDREPGGEPLYAEIRTFKYMISSGLS